MSEQGWQPIHTAPKDGTHVLVVTSRGDVVVSHYVGWWQDHLAYSVVPVRWHPLPPLPASPTPPATIIVTEEDADAG